jgi:hypothetical protein
LADAGTGSEGWPLDTGRIVLRNAAVLDPEAGSLTEGEEVVVEDGRVV